MTPPLPRFAPRLSTAVPDGLVPRELLELRRPDGSVFMTVIGVPVGESVTLDEVADQDRQALEQGENPTRTTPPETTTAFGGRPALRITTTRQDTSVVVGERLYCVDQGWAYVAIAEAAPDERGDALGSILERIDLAGIPNMQPAANEGREETKREPAEPPAVGDWHAARESWTTATVTDEPPLDSGENFTAEELVAVASLCGFQAFPGVRPRLFDGWSDDARRAALGTAARSLVVRGVLEARADGSLAPVETWGRVFAVAAEPDLLVVASRSSATAGVQVSIACSLDTAVVVGAVGPDVLRITAIPVGDLVSSVRATVALGEQGSPTGSGFGVTEAALRRAIFEADPSGLPAAGAELAAAIDGATATSRVLCLFRSGGAFEGGELAWVDTASGLWLVEPQAAPSASEPMVNVTPTDAGAVLAALLSYLPGAESEASRATQSV